MRPGSPPPARSRMRCPDWNEVKADLPHLLLLVLYAGIMVFAVATTPLPLRVTRHIRERSLRAASSHDAPACVAPAAHSPSDEDDW